MTEIPIQSQHDTHNLIRRWGMLTLALIFCASAALTWEYFRDAKDAAPAPQAAAAVVSEATSTTPDRFQGVSLKATSAIVVDETTGKVLYALAPDIQWPLASLTKVALVLAVTEALPLDTIITVPTTTAHFAAGTHWKLSDLIGYTLAISSNDGADVLAQSAAGALQIRFPDAPAKNTAVWRMNQLAGELGLSHTYFLNDNGLDESATQGGAYGSARDVAALFAYAASTTSDTFAGTREQSFTIHSAEGTSATAINTDHALPAIPGLVMGKTGYTDLAEGNLAVVFDLNGHEIVAVVLGSTEQGRFDDMGALIARVKEVLNVQ